MINSFLKLCGAFLLFSFLLILSEQAAQAASVRVHGSVLYQVSDPENAVNVPLSPAKFVTVRLKFPDNFQNMPSAETLTDEQGNFSVTLWLNSSQMDNPMELQILAQNPGATVMNTANFDVDQQPLKSVFQVGPFREENVNIILPVTIKIVDPAAGLAENLRIQRANDVVVRVSFFQAAAQFYLAKVQDALEYIHSLNPNKIIPQTDIHFEVINRGELGNGWLGRTDFQNIRLKIYPDGFVASRTRDEHNDLYNNTYGMLLTFCGPECVLYHEYGHHVHESISSFEKDDAASTAFIEGWAEYFARRVKFYKSGIEPFIVYQPFIANFNDMVADGFDIEQGNGEDFIEVAMSSLWDLGDGNTPGEPYDAPSEERQVFDTIDHMSEYSQWDYTWDRWFSDSAGGPSYTSFMREYEGSEQLNANLASFRGIWEEGNEENWGPKPSDLWNDRIERATTVDPQDELGVQFTVSGKIQNLQKDVFLLNLPAAVQAAIRNHEISIRLDQVNVDGVSFDERPLVISAQRGNFSEQSVAIEARAVQREVQFIQLIEAEDTDLFLTVESLDGANGEYSISFTLMDDSFAAEPILDVGVGGNNPAFPVRMAEYSAPGGDFELNVSVALSDVAQAQGDPYQLEVVEYRDRSGINRSNRWLVNGTSFQRQLDREVGRHYFYRARAYNQRSQTYSSWSHSLLVRTYAAPDAPQGVQLYDYEAPQALVDELERQERMNRIIHAIESGDPTQAEEEFFGEARGEALAQNGSDDDGRIALEILDPQVVGDDEEIVYNVSVSVNGGPWQTLIAQSPHRIFSMEALPGSSYRFGAQACNAVGCSAGSEIFTLQSQVPVPLELLASLFGSPDKPKLQAIKMPTLYWSFNFIQRPPFKIIQPVLPQKFQKQYKELPPKWFASNFSELPADKKKALQAELDLAWKSYPKPAAYELQEFAWDQKKFTLLGKTKVTGNSFLLERKPGAYWFRVCEVKAKVPENCSLKTEIIVPAQ